MKKFIFILIVFIFILNINFNSKNINPKNIYENTYEKNYNIEKDVVDNNWRLTIPAIGLDADISEGTDEETLNKWIGHFEMTGYVEGNIALAAHNRGYPVNYFKDVKNLAYGDEIIYYYHGTLLKYKVIEMNIIRDTQVEVLENTEENIITLITCLEDEPEFRRCVIGVEE